jgi:hypothetical protein
VPFQKHGCETKSGRPQNGAVAPTLSGGGIFCDFVTISGIFPQQRKSVHGRCAPGDECLPSRSTMIAARTRSPAAGPDRRGRDLHESAMRRGDRCEDRPVIPWKTGAGPWSSTLRHTEGFHVSGRGDNFAMVRRTLRPSRIPDQPSEGVQRPIHLPQSALSTEIGEEGPGARRARARRRRHRVLRGMPRAFIEVQHGTAHRFPQPLTPPVHRP